MFLDESGVHWYETGSQYPVFVLGGVLTRVTYAKTEIHDRVTQLKVDHFGDPTVTLHTSDIVRNRGPFAILKDASRRHLFLRDLNQLMRDLDYQVVAVAIKKDEYLAKYGPKALDPYECCLGVLVERFCYEIGEAGEKGWIVAECRRPDLDARLLAVWGGLKRNGTHYVSGADVGSRVRDLLYRKKTDDICGLELADLVVSPIGRHVIGKADHEDFRIVEAKFRRVGNNNNYIGSGLVILP